MVTIKILGSCSGTQPMPERHHTSVVLSARGSNYFFDAGENCSRLAHLGGVDLLNTRAVFISHTHYDHIGGLCGLYWNIRKLCIVEKRAPSFEKLPLFIPEIEAFDGIEKTLRYTEGGFYDGLKFSIIPQKPTESLIYRDENISVFAYRSHHLPDREDGTIRAFSYRVECEDGKSIVLSGDFGCADDLEAPIGAGCDFLLAETGHHKVADVCSFAEGHSVGKLIFYHHGREILENRLSVNEAISACKIKATISFDGMLIEI